MWAAPTEVAGAPRQPDDPYDSLEAAPEDFWERPNCPTLRRARSGDCASGCLCQALWVFLGLDSCQRRGEQFWSTREESGPGSMTSGGMLVR